MGRINRVARRNFESAVDTSAISRAGQPFRQGAQVFNQLSERQQQIDTAAAKSEVARANAELNRQYNTDYDENTTEFANDPTKSTDAFQDRLNGSTQRISDGLTNELSKTMFAETSLEIADRYKLKHDKWNDLQIKKNAVSDIDSTATEYANQAYEAGVAGDFGQLVNIQGLTQDVVVASDGIVASDELGKISETVAKDNSTQFIAGMTRDNPDEAVAMLDSGKLDDIFSLEEKNDLKDSAAKRKKEIELASKADTTLQESQLLERLESPEVDSFNKTLQINEMEINGEISKGFAVQARRLVKSKSAVDALTVNEEMADIVTQIYDLNAISEIDASGYLDGINNLNTEIAKKRADGKLNAADAIKLQNQMKTLTSSKVSGATQDIAIFYTEASEIFKTLPPEDRGLATREMFYATEGNFEIGKQEMIDQANRIVDTINKANRDTTLKSVNAALKVRGARTEEDEAFIKESGFTEADIKETMSKYGMTEQQVLQRLRGQ